MNHIHEIYDQIHAMSKCQQTITDSLIQHPGTVNRESENNAEFIQETSQEMDKLSNLPSCLNKLMQQFKQS